MHAVQVLIVSWSLRDNKDYPFLFWLGVGAFYYVLDVFLLAQKKLATEDILWSDS